MQGFVRLCLVISLACLLGPFPLLGQKVLRVAVNVLEPWKIQERDGSVSGPEIEVASALARHLALKVEFEVAPSARVLELMRKGGADFLTGVLRSPEREQYLVFVEPNYKQKSNKVFYVRKGEAARLGTYEDLRELRVGTRIGDHYFQPFDIDPAIVKEQVAESKQLVRMLLAGHIDAFIITDSQGDYLVRKMGCEDQVERAGYAFVKPNPVYLTVSRASPLADRIAAEAGRMIRSGEVDRIIQDYFRRKKLPLPDYKATP